MTRGQKFAFPIKSSKAINVPFTKKKVPFFTFFTWILPCSRCAVHKEGEWYEGLIDASCLLCDACHGEEVRAPQKRICCTMSPKALSRSDKIDPHQQWPYL